MNVFPAGFGRRFSANEGDVGYVVVELALDQSDLLSPVVIYLILETNDQVVLILLVGLRVPLRFFGLLVLYLNSGLLLQQANAFRFVLLTGEHLGLFLLEYGVGGIRG
jgi:hypothetical protein